MKKKIFQRKKEIVLKYVNMTKINSRACCSMCMWVRAMDLYAKIFKSIEPKRIRYIYSAFHHFFCLYLIEFALKTFTIRIGVSSCNGSLERRNGSGRPYRIYNHKHSVKLSSKKINSIGFGIFHVVEKKVQIYNILGSSPSKTCPRGEHQADVSQVGTCAVVVILIGRGVQEVEAGDLLSYFSVQFTLTSSQKGRNLDKYKKNCLGLETYKICIWNPYGQIFFNKSVCKDCKHIKCPESGTP